MTDEWFQIVEQEVFNLGADAILPWLQDARNYLEANRFAEALPLAHRVLDLAWIKLHTGSWKEVPFGWREVYSLAAFLKAQGELGTGDNIAAARTCDLALMIGSPERARVLHGVVNECQRRFQPDGNAHELLRSEVNVPVVDDSKAIKCIPCPPLDVFLKEYLTPRVPVVLSGGMSAWPAMSSRPWGDTQYLKSIAGCRTVPVEVGGQYTDKEWGQRLMLFSEFVDAYLGDADGADAPCGYLAQHALFDQIPALRRDIGVPDYCSLLPPAKDKYLEDLDTDQVPLKINAWFGPPGTVSPCHFDPNDNLLAQVVGSKYVRLFDPSQSSKLYPRDGRMSNTSSVDVEHPDVSSFPNSEDAEFTEVILREGEMLYIPAGHWHYVRSLSVSLSVNFWWM